MRLNDVIWVSIVFFVATMTEASYLTETEETLAIDYVKSSNTPHCVIVVENLTNHKTVNNLKKFLSVGRYVAFLTETQLFEYIFEEKFADVKTAIIYKISNRENLAQFFRRLNQVSCFKNYV